MFSFILADAMRNGVDTTKVPLKLDHDFWGHFQEHLMMSGAWLCIGMLISLIFFKATHNRKFKIDYNLEKGMIMRLISSDGKKWLIVNPVTLIQWIDVLVLCYFDRGRDKIISKTSKVTARVISFIVIIFVIFCILTGVTLILSAFEKSMDIFDYI